MYIDNLIDAALLALQHDDATGQAFNVSDGLDVTWREFTDGLARGLGRPEVRWSMPYRVANGVGFALEHGYRALRRATRHDVAAAALTPGGARDGPRPGLQCRKAREVLGWEPRVSYEDGLEKTLAWLQDEHLIVQ